MATQKNTQETAAKKYGKDWPIIWRVVAPCAGSYNSDMVFIETDCRNTAIIRFRSLRWGGWPVRMEKVHCGPLPDGYETELSDLRGYSHQNPGTSLREIPSAWIKEKAKITAGGAS